MSLAASFSALDLASRFFSSLTSNSPVGVGGAGSLGFAASAAPSAAPSAAADFAASSSSKPSSLSSSSSSFLRLRSRSRSASFDASYLSVGVGGASAQCGGRQATLGLRGVGELHAQPCPFGCAWRSPVGCARKGSPVGTRQPGGVAAGQGMRDARAEGPAARCGQRSLGLLLLLLGRRLDVRGRRLRGAGVLPAILCLRRRLLRDRPVLLERCNKTSRSRPFAVCRRIASAVHGPLPAKNGSDEVHSASNELSSHDLSVPRSRPSERSAGASCAAGRCALRLFDADVLGRELEVAAVAVELCSQASHGRRRALMRTGGPAAGLRTGDDRAVELLQEVFAPRLHLAEVRALHSRPPRMRVVTRA